MRMRRKPCHNGLAQLAKVVPEGGHFVAVHPGVDEQHASPAVHDNGVALAELAPWISTPSATCLSTGARLLCPAPAPSARENGHAEMSFLW